MNALSAVVFTAVVAVASAGYLGGPVGVAYAGAGQLSTQAGSLNSASNSLRISQSARPVAYQQAFAAPVAYQQAVHAPVAYQQAVHAPVAYQQAFAAPVGVAYAGAGQVSTQAGALTTATYKNRVSQSARPIAYQQAFAAPVAYQQAVHAPVAYAQPALHAAPAVLGSHVAYGYTPLATSLLG